MMNDRKYGGKVFYATLLDLHLFTPTHLKSCFDPISLEPCRPVPPSCLHMSAVYACEIQGKRTMKCIGINAAQLFKTWIPPTFITCLVLWQNHWYPLEFYKDCVKAFGTDAYIPPVLCDCQYVTIQKQCDCLKKDGRLWCGFCEPYEKKEVIISKL